MIKLDMDGTDEESYDGQPETGSDGDYRSSRNEPGLFYWCSKCITFLAYLMALLFIGLIIMLAVIIPPTNTLSLDSLRSDMYIPKQNETEWLPDPLENGALYPPWITLSLSADIRNPNKLKVSLKSDVKLYTYDTNNENSTSYRYMDKFVLDKITFAADDTENVQRTYNLTDDRLLKQVGTWLREASPKQRDFKLECHSVEAELSLFMVSLNLPTLYEDVSILL